MKIVSWNINGIRSNILCSGSLNKKGNLHKIPEDSNLHQLCNKYKPDILCFQETRCDIEIGERFEIPEYPYKYWNWSKGEKARSGKRYSGTSIWSKYKAINEYNCPFSEGEGRFQMLEFNDLYLINVYVPNSGSNVDYRKNIWDINIKKLLENYLNNDKPLIYAGDLNVVKGVYDIFSKHHLEEQKMPGCLKFERTNYKELLNMGYSDVFRKLYPTKKRFTWWSMRANSRKIDQGWRIDYFLIQDKFFNLVKDSLILKEIYGSDHCPILLELEFPKDPFLEWEKLIPDNAFEIVNNLEELKDNKNLIYYPPKKDVFNAFKYVSPKDIKVVIIGQDPYHQPGQANGLSFSVNKDFKIPPSLRNIYNELIEDLNIDSITDKNNNPCILDSGDLTHWAKEGILLLNTALTVEKGKPNSHKKMWNNITDKIIYNLCQINNNAIFILWGNYAQTKIKIINDVNKNREIKNEILIGGHPSPLNRMIKTNFYGKKFFSNVNKILNERNIELINWTIG